VVPSKVTSFGTYSIKVADPLLFYSEVCSKSGKTTLSAGDMAEQYLNEFLMAYTTALASLSANNVLVSDIPMKTMELGRYMAEVLDREWLANRGFCIQSVGIGGISFDEATDKLLEKYANDSILFDPNARAARMTAGIAAGMEAAGSNQGGAVMGFAGMAMGMNAAGAMGAMPGQQAQQMPQAPYNAQSVKTGGWTCLCGSSMQEEFAFCTKCGRKKPAVEAGPQSGKWVCSCGNETEELFCSRCGSRRREAPSASERFKCGKCGWVPEDPGQPPAFCPKCGDVFNNEDRDKGDLK
jgi:membrane protease subunit (stomatin/prohibitin family)